MDAELVWIEVVAALPDRQLVLELKVPPGTSLIEAVRLARLEERLPGLEIDEERLGVFGRVRRPDEAVVEGDRVEVYRPLSADPKEIRRQLAELARAGK